MKLLGIIGGTGIEQLDGLKIVDSHAVDTPYGDPSRVVEEGRLGDTRLFFLQRHGSPRSIPPHLINYRANLWALKSLQVTDVVAINAVGGISSAMRPGRLVLPDQIIDYTWGREHTVDTGEGSGLMHVEFTQPYDQRLRETSAPGHGCRSQCRQPAIPRDAASAAACPVAPRVEASRITASS